MAIDSAKEKNALRVTVTMSSSNQNHLWPDLNMNTYAAARSHAHQHGFSVCVRILIENNICICSHQSSQADDIIASCCSHLSLVFSLTNPIIIILTIVQPPFRFVPLGMISGGCEWKEKSGRNWVPTTINVCCPKEHLSVKC